MAVLDHFTVEVIVDKQPAAEYDDDDDTQPEQRHAVTTYVEAVSSKVFKFRIRVAPTYQFRNEDTIRASLTLDGKSAGSTSLKKRDFGKYHSGLMEIAGCSVSFGEGPSKYCEYAFADLETREPERHDDTTTMKQKYDKLGTMTVKLRRERLLGQKEVSGSRQRNLPEPIPEKALKGRPLDVSTVFKPKETEARPWTGAGSRHYSSKYQHLDRHPMVTFNFKYRTRRALQSLLIIERSPTPIPLEERPIEDLSLEEARERLRIEMAKAKIKPEPGSLKRERPVSHARPKRPLKTTRGPQGEMIYHIDSDDDGDGNEVKGPPDTKGARGSSPIDSEIEVVTL